MDANPEMVKTLTRALAELDTPMPPVEAGDEWKRVYEYARRCGYASSAIKECLQLLGQTNV